MDGVHGSSGSWLSVSAKCNHLFLEMIQEAMSINMPTSSCPMIALLSAYVIYFVRAWNEMNEGSFVLST